MVTALWKEEPVDKENWTCKCQSRTGIQGKGHRQLSNGEEITMAGGGGSGGEGKHRGPVGPYAGRHGEPLKILAGREAVAQLCLGKFNRVLLKKKKKKTRGKE